MLLWGLFFASLTHGVIAVTLDPHPGGLDIFYIVILGDMILIISDFLLLIQLT